MGEAYRSVDLTQGIDLLSQPQAVQLSPAETTPAPTEAPTHIPLQHEKPFDPIDIVWPPPDDTVPTPDAPHTKVEPAHDAHNVSPPIEPAVDPVDGQVRTSKMAFIGLRKVVASRRLDSATKRLSAQKSSREVHAYLDRISTVSSEQRLFGWKEGGVTPDKWANMTTLQQGQALKKLYTHERELYAQHRPVTRSEIRKDTLRSRRNSKAANLRAINHHRDAVYAEKGAHGHVHKPYTEVAPQRFTRKGLRSRKTTEAKYQRAESKISKYERQDKDSRGNDGGLRRKVRKTNNVIKTQHQTLADIEASKLHRHDVRLDTQRKLADTSKKIVNRSKKTAKRAAKFGWDKAKAGGRGIAGAAHSANERLIKHAEATRDAYEAGASGQEVSDTFVQKQINKLARRSGKTYARAKTKIPTRQ